MRNWSTAELVLATLLVTTFTCVGLIALWATCSRRHWFVRAAVVLTGLSVPLLIPACEPLVVFSIQTLIIWIGVSIWRWRQARQRDGNGEIAGDSAQPTTPRTVRFSLATLLLVSPLVALVAGITTKMVREFPSLNVEAITTLALDGSAAGFVVLIGAWLFVARRKWLSLSVGVALCLVIAAVMTKFDWLFSSLTRSGWPPQPAILGMLTLTGEPRPELAWFAVLPAISLATWMMLQLASVAFVLLPSPVSSPEREYLPSTTRRAVALGVLSALVILFVLPSSFVLWKLLHPLPLPNPAQPPRNGLNDVATAGSTFATSPILNTDVEPKSTAELAAEIAKYSAAFDQLHKGLSQPIRVRDWTPGSDPMTRFNSSLNSIRVMRSAARGLVRKAELAQQQGRYADAAQSSLDNVHLGQEITRDGLVVDFLVGVAIEGIGHYTLHKAVSQLNSDECRDLIKALEEIELHREPLDAVLVRDRGWTQHAYGWTAQFYYLMEDLSSNSEPVAGTRQAVERTQAVARLLIVAAALRAFELENGNAPERLEQLTPQFLIAVPTDPFDPNGGPLRYLRAADGAVAYSCGFDHDDDSGRGPTKTDAGDLDYFGDGDFRLDVYLAPSEPESEIETSEDSADDVRIGE